MKVRIWSLTNDSKCWWGCREREQSSSVGDHANWHSDTMGTSVEFLPPNRELVYLSPDPTIPVLGIPKDYILLQRFLLIHVLCCFTHNTQKLETTNEWVMKMCYIYRIIHMLRKGSGILRQIDGARKKSLWVSEITDPKRQILDAWSYMWVLAFKLSLYVF